MSSPIERGIESIGDVLQRGLHVSDERHPIVRLGERDPIPAHIRSAVWWRDRGRCELCAAPIPSGEMWQLDHIAPWSAGGPDDTTNLRVLCEHHNQTRSNFIDPHERPRRPATWWCIRCWNYDMVQRWVWLKRGTPVTCPIHLAQDRCRVTRGHLRAFDLTGEWPTWYRDAPLRGGSQRAYPCLLRPLWAPEPDGPVAMTPADPDTIRAIRKGARP